jgi:hypothetical protein
MMRPDLAARAKTYLAREALLARLPDSNKLLADAKDEMKLYKEAEGYVTLGIVENLAKRLQREENQQHVPGRSSPTVVFQSETIKVSASITLSSVTQAQPKQK